jgi:signal transduction histidine kinase
MIGGLMVFARPPRPNPMDVDVHDVLRPVVEAVRPVAESKRVRFEYSPPPAPVTVRADSAQVGEAVRALIANAIEAASEGGRVVVEASLAATACRVTVADDGHGMDGDAMRRAFDPFHCGRDAGRGIGLGLPKALRLIESNGGRLAVESRPGEGTRVVVSLPTASAEAA